MTISPPVCVGASLLVAGGHGGLAKLVQEGAAGHTRAVCKTWGVLVCAESESTPYCELVCVVDVDLKYPPSLPPPALPPLLRSQRPSQIPCLAS